MMMYIGMVSAPFHSFGTFLKSMNIVSQQWLDHSVFVSISSRCVPTLHLVQLLALFPVSKVFVMSYPFSHLSLVYVYECMSALLHACAHACTRKTGADFCLSIRRSFGYMIQLGIASTFISMTLAREPVVDGQFIKDEDKQQGDSEIIIIIMISVIIKIRMTIVRRGRKRRQLIIIDIVNTQ